MLSEEQTREIFETATFLAEGNNPIKVDDIVETVNHFEAFDHILDHLHDELTENLIKELHYILKKGTSFEHEGLPTGDYKKYANIIGGIVETTPQGEVAEKMKQLLTEYRQLEHKIFDVLVDFHVRFERIHPFQDGNGRVGRLILYKECLNYGIIPFIITDEYKSYYYRGLNEYNKEKGYLMDTLLLMQDQYTDVCTYLGVLGHD